MQENFKILDRLRESKSQYSLQPSDSTRKRAEKLADELTKNY